MRLIDADTLLSEFLRRYTERERIRELVFAACEIKQDFADMVTDAPTIEAEPVVHGRWSYDSEDGWDNFDWHCTECGGSIGYRCGNPVFSRYCPHCGAKMQGGEDE